MKNDNRIHSKHSSMSNIARKGILSGHKKSGGKKKGDESNSSEFD